MPSSTLEGAPRRVVLNAFGAGNLGDDLLLEAALERYGRRSVPLAVGFGAPRFRDPVAHMTYEEFTRSPAARRTFGDCDHVFFGGGLLWSAEHLATMCVLVAGHRAGGGRVDVVGVGLQGSGFDAGVVGLLAELCRVFTVRDATSARMIATTTWSPPVVEDPVFELLAARERPTRPSGDAALTVGLSLSGEALDPARFAHVVELLGTINHLWQERRRAPLRFLFVPHVCHFRGDRWSDLPLGEALAASKLGGLVGVAPYGPDTDGLCASYRRCDVVLSGRFHGLVVPQALGLPAWGLDWDLDPTRSKVSARCIDRATPLFCLDRPFDEVARAVVDRLDALP